MTQHVEPVGYFVLNPNASKNLKDPQAMIDKLSEAGFMHTETLQDFNLITRNKYKEDIELQKRRDAARSEKVKLRLKEYYSRPEVKKRLKAKRADPVQKELKKQRAKRSRKINTELKQKYPGIYITLMKNLRQQYPIETGVKQQQQQQQQEEPEVVDKEIQHPDK